MAVVAVAAASAGSRETLWAVPADAALNKTPIPRGIRNYNGTVAVAALGSGDQTVVTVTLSFPTKFLYYPRDVSCWFKSDDATSEFEQFGGLTYLAAGGNQAIRYVLDSGGITRNTVDNDAINVYRPIGGWRNWINLDGGPTSITLVVTDQSGDTSTAGDVSWTANFWIYDVEQCMNYPVNLFEQFLPATFS